MARADRGPHHTSGGSNAALASFGATGLPREGLRNILKTLGQPRRLAVVAEFPGVCSSLFWSAMLKLPKMAARIVSHQVFRRHKRRKAREQ